MPWPPPSVVALGLQTFTSLPNLAEETVLLSTVSLHPCGTARAGSVLRAGREQGAKCPAPSTAINQRREPGGSAFAAALSQTWCAFAQQLDCRLFLKVVCSTLGSQSETSPKHHTSTLAYRTSALPAVGAHGGKADHLDVRLGCHGCHEATQVPQALTGPRTCRAFGMEGPTSGTPTTQRVFLFHLSYRLLWPEQGVSNTGYHWFKSAGTVHAPSLLASPALG